MERPILELLEEHGQLGFERLYALSGESLDQVRDALGELRNRGLVALVVVGELVGDTLKSYSYCKLTDAGRAAIPSVERETTLEQQAREARERSRSAQVRALAATSELASSTS